MVLTTRSRTPRPMLDTTTVALYRWEPGRSQDLFKKPFFLVPFVECVVEFRPVLEIHQNPLHSLRAVGSCQSIYALGAPNTCSLSQGHSASDSKLFVFWLVAGGLNLVDRSGSQEPEEESKGLHELSKEQHDDADTARGTDGTELRPHCASRSPPSRL